MHSGPPECPKQGRVSNFGRQTLSNALHGKMPRLKSGVVAESLLKELTAQNHGLSQQGCHMVVAVMVRDFKIADLACEATIGKLPYMVLIGCLKNTRD